MLQIYMMCFLIIKIIFAQNIICNGMFLGFTLPANESWTFPANDYNCWFNQNGTEIEINDRNYMGFGYCADLVLVSPYYLCQNITLQIGQQYQLNFTIGTPNNYTYTNVTAYINNFLITYAAIVGELAINQTSQRFIGTSNQSSTLCFLQHSIQNNINFNGAGITNISLYKIINNPTINNTTNNTMDNNTLNTSVTTNDTPLNNITNNLTYKIHIVLYLSIQIVPKYFRYFYLLLEDIWFYKFHRSNYPSSTLQFMQNFDLINEAIPNLEGLQFLKNIFQIEFFQDKQKTFSRHIQFHQKNPQSFYFLNSSQDIYFINFIISFISFSIPKLIILILKMIKQKNRLMKKTYYSFKWDFRYWILLTFIIEGNISKICFFCGLNIFTSFHFDFTDKINFALSSLFMFLVLFYVFIFYFIIGKYQKPKPAKNLLIHSKNDPQGFFMQSYCFLMRSCIRGILHSFLVQTYKNQIIGLIISDILNVSLIIYYNKCFNWKIIFMIHLFYNFVFLLLDTCFLIHFLDPQNNYNINYQLINRILIWTLIVLYLSSILLLTSLSIYQIYQQFQNKLQSKLERKKQMESKHQIEKNKEKLMKKNMKTIKKGNYPENAPVFILADVVKVNEQSSQRNKKQKNKYKIGTLNRLNQIRKDKSQRNPLQLKIKYQF